MAQEINEYSSAALAFLGDSVFELNVRIRTVSGSKGNAARLNQASKALTNAKVQSQMADALKDILTEEEMAVYKRGRNYKAPSTPKSCTPGEYRKATGLEALMGYLHLKGEQERIEELINEGIKALADQPDPAKE